jgi:outer membrane protein W
MFSTGRIGVALGTAALVTGMLAAPTASAQQSVSVYVGGFVPRGDDARGTDDVLFADKDFFTFNQSDFNGPTVGIEWLLPVNYWVDAGFGIGYYQQTSKSFYTDLVSANGADIEQDLKLRIVPFTATFRFLPLGRGAAVRPYVGAGVGVFSWRYSETGSFVDFDDTIFRDSFVGKGAEVGPVVLGGLTVPVGRVDVGGEIRYQSARGTLPDDVFFAPKIDLGGMSYHFVFNIRF